MPLPITPFAPARRFARRVSAFVASVTLISCGGGETLAPTPPPAGLDVAARTLAATTTAQRTTGVCADIQPFYWEIGDKTQRLASASVNEPGNDTTFVASTSMPIASASKWIYGSYVAERRAGVMTAEDIQFLTFSSGYTNFAATGCENGDSVESCANRSTSGVLTRANVGKFFYDGAHMQKHGSLPAPDGMNLGAFTNVGLAAEVRRVLGTEIGLSYFQPQLAGGIRSTATDYAIFLRKLLNNQLRMSALLGSTSVCTNPSTCASALSTPITRTISWSYSVGHWVKTDPATGDGAFSSAGAFGFYPWIDAGKTYYGIISRFAAAGGGNESALCGAEIRRAWMTGVAR